MVCGFGFLASQEIFRPSISLDGDSFKLAENSGIGQAWSRARCRNTDAAKWIGLYARTTSRERIRYVHLPRETRSHKLNTGIAPTSIRNSQFVPLVRPVLSAEEIPLHGINARCLASALAATPHPPFTLFLSLP